jgi:hypothetical protein
MRRGTYDLTILDRPYVLKVGDEPKSGAGHSDIQHRVITARADYDDVLATIYHEVFEIICIQLGYVYTDYEASRFFILPHRDMDSVMAVLAASISSLKRRTK